MTCQGGCNCCLGACCYSFAGTPQCSGTTCDECEALDGDWQGAGTFCTGDTLSDCPCEPPADEAACERCEDGVPVYRCSEGEYCCDGVCQDEPCDEPCNIDADCQCSDIGWSDALTGDPYFSCCPPGYTHIGSDYCEDADGNILQASLKAEVVRCCEGTCCAQTDCCAGGSCVSTCESGENCCINQDGEGGCWPFPGRCGENWCSNCASDGVSTETRIGPYATAFDAGVAATAACSGCDGTCSNDTEQCGSDWYGFVCCTPAVP